MRRRRFERAACSSPSQRSCQLSPWTALVLVVNGDGAARAMGAPWKRRKCAPRSSRLHFPLVQVQEPFAAVRFSRRPRQNPRRVGRTYTSSSESVPRRPRRSRCVAAPPRPSTPLPLRRALSTISLHPRCPLPYHRAQPALLICRVMQPSPVHRHEPSHLQQAPSAPRFAPQPIRCLHHRRHFSSPLSSLRTAIAGSTAHVISA